MPRVACISNLVRARIAPAHARETVLGRVATAPPPSLAIREFGLVIDTDSLAARLRVHHAPEPTNPHRVADVLRNARRRVASYAHRSAAHVAAAPFAVVREARMPLHAFVLVTSEMSRLSLELLTCRTIERRERRGRRLIVG